MIGILGTKDDIRAGIVEEQVRNRLAAGDGACIRMRDDRHSVVVSHDIKHP